MNQLSSIDGLVDVRNAFSVAQYASGAVFSATGLPPGAFINAGTGAITGTLSTSGSYAPVITLTLNGRSASQALSVTVAEVSTPQIIQSVEVINDSTPANTFAGSAITFTTGSNRAAFLLVSGLGDFSGGDITPSSVTIDGVALTAAAARARNTNQEFVGAYYLPEASISDGVPSITFGGNMRAVAA